MGCEVFLPTTHHLESKVPKYSPVQLRNFENGLLLRILFILPNSTVVK